MKQVKTYEEKARLAEENKEKLKLTEELEIKWKVVQALHPFYDWDKVLNFNKPGNRNTHIPFGNIGSALHKGEISLEECEKILKKRFPMVKQNERGEYEDISYIDLRRESIERTIEQITTGNMSVYYHPLDGTKGSYKHPIFVRNLQINRKQLPAAKQRGIVENRYLCESLGEAFLYEGTVPASFYVDLDTERHEFVSKKMEDTETIHIHLEDIVLLPTGLTTIFNSVPADEDLDEVLSVYGIKKGSDRILPGPGLSYSITQTLTPEQRRIAGIQASRRNRGTETLQDQARRGMLEQVSMSNVDPINSLLLNSSQTRDENFDY